MIEIDLSSFSYGFFIGVITFMAAWGLYIFTGAHKDDDDS